MKVPEALPQGFERLLEHDEEVRQLWNGTGKTRRGHHQLRIRFLTDEEMHEQRGH